MSFEEINTLKAKIQRTYVQNLLDVFQLKYYNVTIYSNSVA